MHPSSAEIISCLPYTQPFLFVDELVEVNETGVTGFFTFKKEAFFYEGHFKNNPITPGVILTECMAQIGVVSLGIFLLSPERGKIRKTNFQIAMSSTEMDFYKPVLPGDKVTVVSEKEYFRFNKLKCIVQMFDLTGNLICRGKIAGMVKPGSNNQKHNSGKKNSK